MKFRRCSNKQKLARCTLHKIWINFCQTCILPTVNNFKCVSSIDLEHLRLTPASNCLKPIQTLQNDFYCHLLSLNWMTNYLNTQPYINKLSRSFPLNFPISSGSFTSSFLFFSFSLSFFVDCIGYNDVMNPNTSHLSTKICKTISSQQVHQCWHC